MNLRGPVEGVVNCNQLILIKISGVDASLSVGEMGVIAVSALPDGLFTGVEELHLQFLCALKNLRRDVVGGGVGEVGVLEVDAVGAEDHALSHLLLLFILDFSCELADVGENADAAGGEAEEAIDGVFVLFMLRIRRPVLVREDRSLNLAARKTAEKVEVCEPPDEEVGDLFAGVHALGAAAGDDDATGGFEMVPPGDGLCVRVWRDDLIGGEHDSGGEGGVGGGVFGVVKGDVEGADGFVDEGGDAFGWFSSFAEAGMVRGRVGKEEVHKVVGFHGHCGESVPSYDS